jgi:hypothetical protein
MASERIIDTLSAVADIIEVLKGRELNRIGSAPNHEKEEEDFYSLLRRAREKTKCGKCQRDIDNLFIQNEIYRIMEERGYKSWLDLDEKTKEDIKKEAERRRLW